ncbi:hypothetical protein DBR32_11755 [Taibaiella sp. KBW10]|uniref:lipopolysaccharide biosynthesis protein n=1 Tax=Taibaiella sp. KBW10 TaxID=2153357 RepID=UPI000F59DE07|nr:oligosaccharide flippase family protein [Taibaiella sp. KBW10]RQO30245.1 hypothetical protein DBR32_11755 [Taibaiella sp. KBW10]
MGAVRKQSIYSFIFIFIGFIIGALNTLLLYAKYLSTEQYGLTGVFRDFYVLFAVLATFGSVTALYKFFPLYHARLGRDKNDLPFLITIVGILGCICLIAGCLIFKDLIVLKFGKKSPLFVKHFYLIIPLTVSMVLMNQFEGFAFMLKRTTVSNLVKELGFRIVQTIAILLYIFNYISIDTFFLLFAFMYIPSLIIMLILVTYNKGIKLNFRISNLTKKIYRKVISFSLFHFSGGVIAVLPFALNGILIAGISERGLYDVGIYTIATFMVSMLEVPLRGMRGIGIATYSEAFLHNDLHKVGRMQQNASLNLLIVGFFIFGLIYPNIENIVYFSKGKDFHPIVNIFLIAGSAKLIELSMGMNDSLLSLSKYWRTDFFVSSGIVLLSIPINIWFIKWDPLLGAAVGQAIVLILFCFLRSLVIWKYFHIQPYTYKTFIVMGMGIVTTAITYYIPASGNVFADIFIKGLVFSSLYLFLIYRFKISSDINGLYAIAKQRLSRS